MPNVTKCETVKTTVQTLVASINVTTDCQIESHLNGADRELITKLGREKRIVAVDGNPVADITDLRAYLMTRKEKDHIVLSFEDVSKEKGLVSISESVKLDGSVCNVAPQKPRNSVIEELNRDDSTPSSPGSASLHLPRDFSGHVGNKSEGGDEFLSVASSSDFMTDVLRDGDLQNVPSEAKIQSKASSTPTLLEFEKIGTTAAVEDLSKSVTPREEESSESSIRNSFKRALETVKIGSCIICVCREVNPIAEIELIAIPLKITIIAIDLGVKLRLRPRPDAFAKQFKDAMNQGSWFVLIHAHKSIATLRVLEELVKDAESRNFEGFNPSSKIIICLEPHPHFPRLLMKNAVVTKIRNSLSGSALLAQSLANSTSRSRLITTESMRLDEVRRASSSCSGFVAPSPKRRVRISAAVDVVDIDPREVLAAQNRERVVTVSGSVALRAAFTGVTNDKFLCVSSAGEKGRFAVGSSLGNVYFVDGLGNSLLQAHAHDASIWDLSFSSKFCFATGCEDGNSTEWTFKTKADEAAVLEPISTTPLGNDVYCLTYLQKEPNSPLLIGGLSHTLMLRGSDASVKSISISSNAQVMDSFPFTPIVLVGGSDGSVSAIHIPSATVLSRFKEHTRKLPALAIRDENQFFTGSFDSSILFWDYRAPTRNPAEAVKMDSKDTASPTHTLKLKSYVTGLGVDDVHLAASVGENLYLWDVRKLGEVLGGYPQGWRGLSRGVVVHSADQCVVTASQDGYVRFWQFV